VSFEEMVKIALQEVRGPANCMGGEAELASPAAQGSTTYAEVRAGLSDAKPVLVLNISEAAIRIHHVRNVGGKCWIVNSTCGENGGYTAG